MAPVPTPRKRRRTPSKSQAGPQGSQPPQPGPGPPASADRYLRKDSAEVSTCQRQQAQPHALPQTEPAPHRPQCPAPQPLQWVWPSAPLSPSPGPQRRHSHSFPLHLPARDTPSWKPSSHLLDRVGNSGQGPSPVDASSGPSPRPPRAGRVPAPGVLPSHAAATSALLQPHAPPPPGPGRPAQPASHPSRRCPWRPWKAGPLQAQTGSVCRLHSQHPARRRPDSHSSGALLALPPSSQEGC